MKLIFDYRVLTHKIYTGVENYANNIFNELKDKYQLNISRPLFLNKYLAHIWTHIILPFKKGEILYCPANIAPIYVSKSKKLVVTIHDIAFITQPHTFSKLFRVYYKILMPCVIRRADKIITVSEYSKKEIVSFYPEAKRKIEVIYLGVDKKFKKLDNTKKKKQILYVGSMNQRKNFIGVLKSFELLNNDDYRLLVIGNFNQNFSINKETEDVLERARKNKKIKFISNISDSELVKIYNESELFLFPSFYEGFGLPVLEAMACGTPVICSDVSSLPEVASDATEYCDPTNINSIKDKIELVLSCKSLQEEMIKKGLERAKLFSWEKSASSHIKVFEEVLKN